MALVGDQSSLSLVQSSADIAARREGGSGVSERIAGSTIARTSGLISCSSLREWKSFCTCRAATTGGRKVAAATTVVTATKVTVTFDSNEDISSNESNSNSNGSNSRGNGSNSRGNGSNNISCSSSTSNCMSRNGNCWNSNCSC
ncbi:hypothetical protein FHG87_016734 [Trinorchestia longiramus]|nr:hypothetical protein FHG87_016734 [Trinorchestia longiramus]